MQNWKDLYTELCAIVKAQVPAIRWQDLWRNQIGFLETEDSFPAPALFWAFRIRNAEDTSLHAQRVQLQVTTYLYYESLAGTQEGSWNQGAALQFLTMVTDVYAALHGSVGVNYSGMRRTGFDPMETSGAGSLYQMNFECLLMDYAALREEVDQPFTGIDIQNQAPAASVNPTQPLFTL